jgi:hypothetical protein
MLVNVDQFGINKKKIIAVAYEKALKLIRFDDLLNAGIGCPYTVEPAAVANSCINASGNGSVEFYMPEAGTYRTVLKID